MQFSQIYAEVGNLTPSTGVARDKQFVNEAYHSLNSERRWSWLVSTTSVALVAGQRSYVVLGTSPVVTDFDSPISVTLELTASGARRKLPRVDAQFFEDLTGHISTNAEPFVWTIQGGTAATTPSAVVQGGQQAIIVNPPIATAGHGVNLLIRYWRSASSIEMSADTDVPILPANLHHMIIDLACAKAMTRYNMAADAQMFMQSYQSQLAKAMDADQAMWSGDNDTLVLMPPVQVSNQSPLTAADRNPSTRPLPVGV